MSRSSGDELEITLWLVGINKEEARGNFPFDSFESAFSYSKDNPGTRIYSVTATIDFETIELVQY